MPMLFLAIDVLGTKAIIGAPSLLIDDLVLVFPSAEVLNGVQAADIRLNAQDEDWQLEEAGSTRNIARDCLFYEILGALHRFAAHSQSLTLNAVALGLNGRSVLLVSSVNETRALSAAWGIDKGFDYLASAAVRIESDAMALFGFPGPLMMPKTVAGSVSSFGAFKTMAGIISNDLIIVPPDPGWPPNYSQSTPVMTIFPNHVPGGKLFVQAVNPSYVRQKIERIVIRNGGASKSDVDSVAALAGNLPGLFVSFGNIEQLTGVVDQLMRYALTCAPSRLEFDRLVEATTRKAPAAYRYDVPPTTPKLPQRKLTIGMATYDDYDGVYFSVQALRLYHPEVMDEVEILIVDNNPTGPAAAALKSLDKMAKNLRYVPLTGKMGSSVAKGHVFDEAGGEFVLCMDCHVLIVPGAIRKLLNYLRANPETGNLLQGPIVRDDLATVSTHWKPGWKTGTMPGIWADPISNYDYGAEPFPIPMQGLGLFACRRAAWPGFSPKFRGFSGEEGYLHEKFRQRGFETICLPFLGWVHRFSRPFGAPPTAQLREIIRNQLVGLRELALPMEEMLTYMRATFGDELVNETVRDFEAEFSETP